MVGVVVTIERYRNFYRQAQDEKVLFIFISCLGILERKNEVHVRKRKLTKPCEENDTCICYMYVFIFFFTKKKSSKNVRSLYCRASNLFNFPRFFFPRFFPSRFFLFFSCVSCKLPVYLILCQGELCRGRVTCYTHVVTLPIRYF